MKLEFYHDESKVPHVLEVSLPLANGQKGTWFKSPLTTFISCNAKGTNNTYEKGLTK